MRLRRRAVEGWGNLSLRGKGLVVVAVPLVALVAAVLSFYALQRLQQIEQARIARAVAIRDAIQHAQVLLLSQEMVVRTLLLGVEPRSTQRQASLDRLYTVLPQLDGLLKDDPVQLERLNRVKVLLDQELQAMTRAAEVRPGAPPPPNGSLPLEKIPIQVRRAFLIESEPVLDEIDLQLGFMLAREETNLMAFTQRAQRIRRWTAAGIIGSGLFGVAVGLLAVFLFTSGVVHRVQRTAENARRLAEGRALLPMSPGTDAVGRLGVALEEARALLASREDALRQAKDEAERANLAKSTFLSNVSHELRTPLNAILGFTNLVLDRAAEQLPGRQVENLRKVRLSAEQLLHLINGLLDLSKIEAGKIDIVPESFRVEEIMQVAVSTVEPALRRDVQLVTQIDDGLPPLHTDRQKLQEILLNLLSNAAKFTEAGSVSVSVCQVNGMLQVAVSDSGIGISADDLPHIFEEFRQADMSRTRRYGGTGLGLTIVKKFTDLLGGSVHVVSEVGRGSTFTVLVPFTLPSAVQNRVA